MSHLNKGRYGRKRWSSFVKRSQPKVLLEIAAGMAAEGHVAHPSHL